MIRVRTSLRAFGLLAVISALVVATAVALPASPAVATTYCGIYVPPHTDCANVAGGGYVNGHFKNNAAEINGGFGYSTCEHAYRAGSGETISDRCATAYVNSECDLTHYTNEISGHAGNNSSVEVGIYGYATNIEVECS